MRRTWLLVLLALAVFTAACSTPEPMPEKMGDGVPPANAANQKPEPITDRMAQEHADDSPTPSPAATTAPTKAVVGEEVEYAKLGKPIHGYVAHPKGKTSGLPGIIVVHEWWGLNDNIRAMTRRLAGEGYVALAVDLYDGQVATTPDQARQLMGTTLKNQPRALVNLSAARQYLVKEYNPPKMGIIGWCFGGGEALRGALNMGDHIDAVVMYYGEVITDKSKLADLKAPLLGMFGSADKAIPPKRSQAFEKALDETGKDAHIYIFDGVGHAFANPSGKNYNKKAAQKAWGMTTRFFAKHLQQ